MDRKNLTMTFCHENNKVVIRGDPSLTKTRVSLKSMMKAWTKFDKGFLIECRALEGGISLAELYGVDGVPTIQESIPTVLAKFKDAFEWLEELPPRREIEHHIHLKKGTDLVNVRPYRHAYQQKAKMEKLVDEMLTSGVMCPSIGPYSSPVPLVKKKDGSWRFYVDYNALNDVMIVDKFPIIMIEELDELNGVTLFSKIDLKAGYHQIIICIDDIEKTTFRTHEGHYEFLVTL